MPIAINGTGSIAGVTPGGVQSSGLVLGSAVATTSGTSIDYTGIPSWAKRVTLLLNGVSTNGTSLVQVQLGSATIQTTGYISIGGLAGATNIATGSSSSTGIIVPGAGANLVRYGQVIITPNTGNTYLVTVMGGVNDVSVNSFSFSAGGAVTLSGVLDRIRLTTLSGADTFDLGSTNLLWE